MPCYHPMVAARMPSKYVSTGNHVVKFLAKASSWSGPAPVNGMLLPCRKCVGCRLAKAREWAIRLMHEKSFWEKASFLTLTYDDDKLPSNYSLDPKHLNSFFKKLRAREDYYAERDGREVQKIKYFACGEYGERWQRPHYHVALFGLVDCYSGDDQRVEEEPSRSGGKQFSHQRFSEVWEHGLHRFSELTFESAGYIARYVLKKAVQVDGATYWGARVPEFQRMSKGLGRSHVEKWTSDVYPGDSVVVPGAGVFGPPDYYDRCLSRVDPVLFERVKAKREEEQQKCTSEEWFQGVIDRAREEHHKNLVVKASLKREGTV